MPKTTNANRINELWNSETGKFAVCTADGISVKYLPTLELAQELADLMSRKHHETYTAKEL